MTNNRLSFPDSLERHVFAQQSIISHHDEEHEKKERNSLISMTSEPFFQDATSLKYPISSIELINLVSKIKINWTSRVNQKY
jgi:hypothetical protein